MFTCALITCCRQLATIQKNYKSSWIFVAKHLEPNEL